MTNTTIYNATILPSELAMNAVPVRDSVNNFRETKDITSISSPNYNLGWVRPNAKDEITLAVLKHRLNPINVSDSEKRLMTVKAYFHKQNLPLDLCLIDNKTVEYINYHTSGLMPETVSEDDLKEFKINRESYQSNKELMLETFARMVRLYEESYNDNDVLPIAFFIDKCYSNNRDLNSPNLIKVFSECIRVNLTVYAIIYEVAIPSEYIQLNAYTKELLLVIRNKLNNIQETELDDDKAVSHLKLV